MLLCSVAKQDGKRSMSELGKGVYNTNVTIYNNMTLLRDMGYIVLSRKKNKIISELTALGRSYVDAMYEVHKTIYQVD